MDKTKFWSSWKRSYKKTYLFLLIILIGSVIGSVYFQINGEDSYLPLEIARKTESINVALYDVKGLATEYTDSFKSYIVFQTSLSLTKASVKEYSIFYLLLFTFCLAFLATATTYLSRIWFLLSQAVFVIWIITLKIPYLKVLGISNHILEYAIIIIFLGLGYLYHVVYFDKSLLQKFISFLALSFTILALITFTSHQSEPLLFSAHHAIIIPILLSFLFIANVSYDVLLSILLLLASKRTSHKNSNFKHFLILGFLYLSYVSLTFLRNDFAIKWDIVYLDEFLLLIISAFIGIWGFKRRSELIKRQLEFIPLGAYVYLVMGFITFITISWLFATSNDPLIDTFEDVIIFSHIGFGLGFILYVILNFLEFLKTGAPIGYVLFQPKRLPTSIIRLIGISLLILFILRVNYVPYFQALSGYYNSVATYYTETGNDQASLTSYKIAKQYASTNHLSNFSIGLDYYQKKDWVKSAYYFGKATFKKPTVQAFMNRAQAQLNAGLVFESLFTLEDAQRIFPDNSSVLNMKGIIFEKLNQVDSAYLYFDAASQVANNQIDKEVGIANKLGVLAKNKVNEPIAVDIISTQSTIPLMVNFLANSNAQKSYQADKISYSLPSDSALTYNDFSLVFNLLSNQSLKPESFNLNIESIISLQRNKPFAKSLLYASAINRNYIASQKIAYSQIYELENSEISDAGYYHLIHGFWLMDQEAYGLAIEQFSKAERRQIKEATYCKIIALLKEKRVYEAALAFENWENKPLDHHTEQLELLFQNNFQDVSLDLKYLWYQANDALSMEERKDLESQFEETSYRDLIKLNEVHKALRKDSKLSIIQELEEIDVEVLDDDLKSDYHNLTALTSTLFPNQEPRIPVKKELLTIYPKNYQLLFASYQASKNNSNQADSLMYELGMQNVFFEEGIKQAVEYFNNKEQYEKAYSILVEAARLNVYSMPILKWYTLQSLKVNLKSYAEAGLEDLADNLSDEDYQNFLKTYNNLKEQIDNKTW